MFFKRKRQVADEFCVMRKELMDYCTETYRETYAKLFKEFAKQINMHGSRGPNGNDYSFIEQHKGNILKTSETVERELNQILAMNDGDVKELYYATFNRWHPIGWHQTS